MNRSCSAVVLLAFVTAATSLVACASPTEDDASGSAGSASSLDPRPSLAKDARGVTLTMGGKITTVAAPKKVAAVMKALEGRHTALGGAPRCGPPRFTLDLLGEDTKAKASVQVCGENTGFLKADGKWYEVPVEESALLDVFASDRTVGDILWGATRIKAADGDSADGAALASYTKAFDLDSVPEKLSASATPRCAPVMTFTFADERKDIATVAVSCPKEENDTAAPASIHVDGKLVGWATFDIARVFGGGF